MISALACLIAAPYSAEPIWTEPQPWALGLAPPGVIALAGNVTGDGQAEIVTIAEKGVANIVITPTVEGVRAGVPYVAFENWGENCQAATLIQADETAPFEIAGLFDGQEIRLAAAGADGKLVSSPAWAKLPKRLTRGMLHSLESGKSFIAGTIGGGLAYEINARTKTVRQVVLPRGTTWVGQVDGKYATANDKGEMTVWSDEFRTAAARYPFDSHAPASGGKGVCLGSHIVSGGIVSPIEAMPLPASRSLFRFADVDGDGDEDLLEFRMGKEAHTAHQVILRRRVSPGEPDADRDGLTDDREAALGTNPRNIDTDGDGFLDGWEVGSYRDLNFAELGCDPLRMDVICLYSRFDDVDVKKVDGEVKKIIDFYAGLAIQPKGMKAGVGLHLIPLDPVKGADMKSPWWANRDKFRPAKWRGLVHWMQITNGGGGQADQFGDGGTVGANALWAVFIHEFGHQLGLDHSGFWRNGMCPIYPSLMNYNYSYGFENDYNKIHYSQGKLANFVLDESNLDETLPLPMEAVKFLSMGPYNFRLKENGATTLIDWNWNGVFGEKNVKADVNYAYSTDAGVRANLGKCMTAPFLFVHEGAAYALFGTHDESGKKDADPTIRPDRPGRLVIRRHGTEGKWSEPAVIATEGLFGDPIAVSVGRQVWVYYPTADGVLEHRLRLGSGKVESLGRRVVTSDPAWVPSAVTHGGKVILFLTHATTGSIDYHVHTPGRGWEGPVRLRVQSTNPIGACEDTLTGELIIGLAQHQDEKRPNRWQIRRFMLADNRLLPRSVAWVSGDDGQSRGHGRITVLFDPEGGPHGRIYFYGLGMTNPKTPWACAYVAHEIADRSVGGGWLVKRYYDEWSQSRSAPAACWYRGEILYAYRWVDGGMGETDNNLHLGYRGSGISNEPMGDHDDLAYLQNFGIRNSILYLGRP